MIDIDRHQRFNFVERLWVDKMLSNILQVNLDSINQRSIVNFLERKFLHFKKELRYSNLPDKQKNVVAIIGCQRSGTSMLARIFDKDYDSKVFDEFSQLSNKDENKIRLNPLGDVQDVVENQKANLIVLKPIVETQNIEEFLDFFPNSSAIFIFRHFKDVVNSNLRKFGFNNGIDDLRPIIKEEKNNWRTEHISTKTKRIIEKHYSEKMSGYDAAALFWYVRNIIFYDLSLDEDNRIQLCNYEHLVKNPADIMSKIYEDIGYEYPGDFIIKDVFETSVGKGRDIELDEEVEKICKDLYLKLEGDYFERYV